MSENTGKPSLQWVRTPLQGRSRRSLQRILDAAEAILREKRFTEMTVAEIVRRAGSSVGVFYSRFPAKLSLLHYLDERFTAEAEETFRLQLDPALWRGRSRAEAGAEIVRFLFRVHESNQGVLRAIIVQVRLAPDDRFRQTGERLSLLIDRLAGFLLRAGEGDGDGGQEQLPDLRLALMMLISTIRDVVVFGDTTNYPQVLGLPGEQALPLLTRAFHRLLGIAGG